MIKMHVDNEINNEIRFLAQSEIRLKILSELNKRPYNVRGLVKETKITYSSVSSNVAKLEENNYIKKLNGQYYIDPMAKIYFKTLMDFKKSIEIIKDFNAFWHKHNIGQMSIDSMRNINDLKNSKLIETTPIDIYKTHTTIKNQLLKSKEVKAIFPYLHPEYPKLLERILKNGGSIELILPREITRAIMRPIDENLKKNAIKKGKLKIHSVKDDLNLYLTICDKNMSLGLFKNDGSFDQNRILISKDEKSYEWAEELFEYVKDKVI
jgi:predicted transcriptional regulator